MKEEDIEVVPSEAPPPPDRRHHVDRQFEERGRAELMEAAREIEVEAAPEVAVVVEAAAPVVEVVEEARRGAVR